MNAAPLTHEMPGEGFYSPFHLSVQPMQRLFLVDFVKNSDPIYRSLELQIFDHEETGKGLLVIAYRQDTKVDIYYQAGVTPKGNYSSLAGGLADKQSIPFEAAKFDVGPFGVDIDCTFTDKTGRLIKLRVHENGPQPRKPWSLLAPLGSGNKHPDLFPIYLMYDFSLVRQAGSEISVLIDGKALKTDTIPVPILDSMVYMARYSTAPYILQWNRAFDGALSPACPDENGQAEHQGCLLQLEKTDSAYALRSMRPSQCPPDPSHDIQFCFSPALPDPTRLAEGAQVDGQWSVAFGPSAGKIEGQYTLQRSGSQVNMSLVAGKWQPGERHWSLQLFFFLVSMFKNWPRTYRWQASLDLSQPGAPHLTSNWQRI